MWCSQGSGLSQVLFVSYTEKNSRNHCKVLGRIQNLKYTDTWLCRQLQLFSSCKTQSLEASILNLERCSKTTQDCLSQYKLKANPDKFMEQQNSRKYPCLAKIFNHKQKIFDSNSSCKNLEVKVGDNLTLKNHITNLKGTCAGRLIQLSKLRGTMSKEKFKNVVSATVILKITMVTLYILPTCRKFNKFRTLQQE